MGCMFCRPCQLLVCGWLALAGWTLPLVAGGVEPGASPSSFRIKRWTTEQGLPQNRIACLKQTHDGYLWIGTWFGLVRFDGMRFTVFNKFNTPELVDDAINALAEDADGTLWIGTGDSLVSYHEHRFHRLTTAEGLPDWKVWRLAGSRSGGVWVHSGPYVTRLDRGKFSRVWRMEQPVGGFFDGNTVHAIREGADGWLNIFTGTAWLGLSPKADELRTNQIVPASSLCWTGFPDVQAGSCWMGTSEGVLHYENGASERLGREELGRHSVDFVYQDRGGNVWANTQPGVLHRWDHNRWQTIDLGNVGATICMEQDHEGNLWAGTDQGLVQIQTQRVRTYTPQDGLADANVWSVCEGTDGAIWVGTGHGLSCIRSGRVVRLDADEPVLNEANRCIWPAANGGVWVPKPGLGLLEFRDGVFVERGEKRICGGLIGALYGDRSGRLWIASELGLVVLKDGYFTNCPISAEGHRLHDVHSILEDREGSFWFGTKGQGLVRWHEGTGSVFTDRDGLSNNSVWSIYEDGDGALWLGTENGLTLYRKGRFFAFTRQHGLPENTVNCILEDDSGHLWLSGLRGIYRVERAQLNAIAQGRAGVVQCIAIGTADGMESSETNGETQPAGWKARDGRLWFPTTQGVVVIDPKTIQVCEVPPPVVVEQVKADEEVIFGDLVGADESRLTSLREAKQIPPAPNTAIRLAPGRAKVVEFRYTANTFVDPKRARFRYRLVGHDAGWRDETSERAIHYTNLRPGNYRFEVAAANHNGVWNLNPGNFAFSLAPHFWQTWPFYVLCVVAVVGLALAVQAYRLRWQHRLLKLEEQRALANERARIARDLHDDLGTALTGLALELDVVGRENKDAAPLAERLGQTARRTRDLAERMREVVWTVNPRCDTVSSLANFLEQQVSQFLRIEGVQVRLDFPEDIPALPLGAEARHQLALGVREALTNLVRHAQATEALLSLALVGQTLVVQVKDNGRGFQPGEATGLGLANMRARLEQIGGSFECVSAPGAGTIIKFKLPLTTSILGEETVR
jgi:signal transduction histidine kinase/ligand-binding sensor domain-containing protein